MACGQRGCRQIRNVAKVTCTKFATGAKFRPQPPINSGPVSHLFSLHSDLSHGQLDETTCPSNKQQPPSSTMASTTQNDESLGPSSWVEYSNFPPPPPPVIYVIKPEASDSPLECESSSASPSSSDQVTSTTGDKSPTEKKIEDETEKRKSSRKSRMARRKQRQNEFRQYPYSAQLAFMWPLIQKGAIKMNTKPPSPQSTLQPTSTSPSKD